MLNRNEAAELALSTLVKDGANEAQAILSTATKEEFNFALGKPCLLRTTTDQNVSLAAIRGGRKAALGLNRFDAAAITGGATELRGLCDAGESDPAHGFSPETGTAEFSHGPPQPDLPLMRTRMGEFLDAARSNFPKVILEEGFLDFTRTDTTYCNSHGVEYRASQGHYGMVLVFSAKDGERTSGFNYTHGQFADLSRPLAERFNAWQLLEQAAGQLDRKTVPAKFEGELLITPHCLSELLDAYLGYLGDMAMINGTSIFRDKLGSRIASPRLSVRAEPRGPELASHEFFDGDGFASRAFPVLESGVLKSFLLSHYGARKTGQTRAPSSGSRLVVAGGDEDYTKLLRSMKKGILLCRFSGGRPSLNGDFSGVAKNSYYVENGEIRYPVSETMVSGNLARFFDSLLGVSKERIAFGMKLLPWMLGSGVTVSGK